MNSRERRKLARKAHDFAVRMTGAVVMPLDERLDRPASGSFFSQKTLVHMGDSTMKNPYPLATYRRISSGRIPDSRSIKNDTTEYVSRSQTRRESIRIRYGT